ncbi:flavin-containing monooxygenase [Halorientalis halophila]|uniref:flavin-containing monooxygenase n=1 Tax=Halorientalis halophila TaxID=3108499 RepID=UPI0030084669
MVSDRGGREGGASEVDVDAVVVGAGFSGLYMLHRLREQGLSVRVYEKGDAVGGTWYWNRYPGARCDSESHIYCYSFDDDLHEEWEWSERYPEQPEILEYLQWVAERLDLRRNVEFETEVASATYDDESARWTVEMADGEPVTTRFFITAVGCLSKPFRPDFDGLDEFEGDWYHTARWPEEDPDFGDQHVGVIGTGSTGIQFISEVGGRAKHLTVFQRTPNYAVPARNRPLSADEYEEIRANYDDIWERARDSRLGMPFDHEHETDYGLSDEEIEAILEERWQQGGFRFLHAFEPGAILSDAELNEKVSEFIREKIRERVDDPETAEKLVPTDHPYGAKRPPMDYNDYYGTYNRDDVSLVDVDESPIERVTAEGVQTEDGHYELDTLVFATGFDAMTGALLALDIEGRDQTLEEKWEAGPRTYLGLMTHGFPNLFTITGPQSPSVLTNMPLSIEQHVEWIADCIAYMDEHGYDRIEAEAESESQWVQNTNMLAENMLFSEAKSWYRGANVPGKTQVFTPFPGGLDNYREICARVARDDYDGFELGAIADAG